MWLHTNWQFQDVTNISIMGPFRRWQMHILTPAKQWTETYHQSSTCAVECLANTRTDEWLLLSYREMATCQGISGASPKFDVTFTDDLNTEHRLLMWNRELSWSLCDYKYLAASLALTNIKASKPKAKSETPRCILPLLHSTAYNVQFISVLKILL